VKIHVLCVFVWMLSLASLGRRVSVRKGLVGYLNVVRGRMASSSVSLKDEVESLRAAVKEQVGETNRIGPLASKRLMCVASWACTIWPNGPAWSYVNMPHSLMGYSVNA